MSENTPLDVTRLLVQLGRADQQTKPEFVEAIFKQLRRIAQRHLFSERRDHTLQATAVVHEAYLRLMQGDMNWENRGHFFGVASRLMREVLIDYARAHNAEMR